MSSPVQNNMDEFSEQIQKKLQNLEIQPDPQVWTNVSSSLNRKSSRKLWFYYSSVASFLLLISFILFNNKMDVKNMAEMPKFNSPVVNDNAFVTLNDDSLKSQVQIAYLKSSPSTEPQKRTTESQENNQAQAQENSQAQAQENNQAQAQEKVRALYSDKKQIFELAKTDDSGFKVNSKKKGSWGLKISASSGALALNTSVQSTPRMMMISNPALVNDIQTYIPGTDEFAKRHYALPISYNALISKSITNKIAVESGLSLTSLTTIFSEYKWGDIDASLRLYYIGFPLQLNFQIAKFDKSSIGLTTGIMLEKGLQSVYTQNVYYTGSTYFTRVKESIEGYQFSAKLGGDYSYELLPDFDFYFSPSLQYFPDNNQPMSIRKEMPLQLNLQLGVKYNI